MKSDKIIYKAAIGNGISNAIVNGIITWFTFSGKENIPFSLDSISNKELTIFGTMFPVILGLSLILGTITFFTFKKTAIKEKIADEETINKPYFPKMLLFLLGRGFSAIGFLMVIAILWQRFLGTVQTNSLVATITVAVAAGLAATYVGISVSKEIIRKH